jgi:hypothetical protein
LITAKEAYEKSMSYRNIKEVMSDIEQAILAAVKSGWTSVRIPISSSIDINARKYIVSELETLGYRASYNVGSTMIPILCVSW